VPRENVIVDPGVGLRQTLEQNLEIVGALDEFKCLNQAHLVGRRDKSMIGLVLLTSGPPDQRLEGTAGPVAISIAKGADIVRRP